MKRLFFALFIVFGLHILTAFAGGGKQNDKLWTEIDGRTLRFAEAQQITPDVYRVFSLDKANLTALLKRAPQEFTEAATENPLILTLPMPDGSLARFRVEHSLVVEPGLAAKFPELSQTYRGQGIDDSTATVRFDFLPSGFHSMILSSTGTVMVDPFAAGDTYNYISYFKRDTHSTEQFSCNLNEVSPISLISGDKTKTFDADDFLPDTAITDAPGVTSGTTLRTYRLALAATNEYAVAVGGNTVAGTLAAQVLIMNRVNGVYERDVAIHMNIIANNNLIVYAGDNTCAAVACTAANDPYTNNNGSVMLGQNQANVDLVIGSGNYDIGHVFSTGGGGVASLGVPCNISFKARGVTGLTNPVGDPFAIDYVAHEMGHQWGANHTFNGTVGSCGGGNRSRTSAFEPGSGVTIMGYAGICGNQDLASNSIDTFHVKSLEVIIAYSQTGAGNACSVQTATGNTAPTFTSGSGTFNIPKQTPFALTANATDPNSNSITYDWQEYDVPPNVSNSGADTTQVPNSDADGVARPIFRPYLPTTSGTRTFPSLQYILNNANVPPATTGGFLTGELLPAITRVMTFQAVARDNRANGGGINTVTATVNVDGSSGPFVVTLPNTNVSWNGGLAHTVTWNVAGTINSPVSAATVNIKLSTDGGQTFPTTLAAGTTNDGSESVIIPNSATTTARIKVEAANSIFFDISDTNFTINIATAAPVSIGGRVLTANGRGIARARVSMTNQQGETITVLTNPFGYYHFDDIPSGLSYIFTITDKRYQFDSSVIFLNNNIEDYNFTALP